MSEHINIKSYEGVENYSTFDSQGFKDYCKTKLKTCEKHIHFIRQNIGNSTLKKVVEVGAGNGKLLFLLEQEGLLDEGIGYELSSSRVLFSNEFAKLLKSSKVSNINSDFLNQDFEHNSVDLVIAVDLVIQLISSISKEVELDFFKKVFDSIRPGGFFLMELMDFTHLINMHELNNGNLKVWEEFHQNDPWQYGLYEFHIEGENIIWDKYFISRKRQIQNSNFSNILKQYSFESIKQNLLSAGFAVQKIHKYNYWESEGDILDEEYIILASKN